ncbi:MAG: bifunctional riboflavin kinase/FAD synthetase [Arcobacteraceae bacterium]|nr:bifunctional riboflavin kinase/FAD synthetase [Arcobacteraceae bacterium]
MLKSCFTLKSNITSIAIGGFDGMHLAHQELFRRLDEGGGIVVIETGYANLTPKKNRAKYSSYPLFYYPLDDIKHLTPPQFVALLNEEFPKLEKIVVGFDFKFGVNASGSIAILKSLFSGVVEVVNEFFFGEIAVHSRVIRDFISTGDIPKANQFLGKNYTINGLHVKGQGLGKKQFVPTINIECEEFLVPSSGIYATFSRVDEVRYKSVTFIGHRVSTDGKYAIETHILENDLKEINSHIEIEFIEKIRENQKYDDMEQLKLQILDDIEVTKRILL